MVFETDKVSRCIRIMKNNGRSQILHSGIKKVVYDTYLFYIEEKVKKLRMSAKYGCATPDPYKIIWISPKEVQLWRINHDKYNLQNHSISFSNPDGFYIDPWIHGGEIRGGEWDNPEQLFLFEKMPKFQGLEDHFVNDVPWQSTELFNFLLNIIKEKGQVDGCMNREDLIDRYNKIDDLYRDMKVNGYKTRRENTTCRSPKSSLDEIGVSIGRNGAIIFQGGGWHRLSIAKILKIDQIPVRVVLRHEKWQQIRKEIISSECIDDLSISAIRNLAHPDLTDVLKKSNLDT